MCDPLTAASWRSGQPLTFEQSELGRDRVFTTQHSQNRPSLYTVQPSATFVP